MTNRLLRHVPTNTMYVWRPEFAEDADFEEIIDVESREVPTPARAKLKKAVIVDDEALFADASHNLP